LKAFTPKPYKLSNKIQNYEWGTKNEDAFIPKFIGIKAELNIPYAELWIGAHPKSPSELEIDSECFPLDRIIESHCNEVLGSYVKNKFGGKFPFLLKVLSSAKALSIQLHPDKRQAENLHSLDSKNYPDDNHKPEIAIAEESLIAVAGFRPVNEIIENLRSLPEIKFLTGSVLIEKILESENKEESKELIKKLYQTIMTKADDKEKLSVCIKSIYERLNNKSKLSSEEEQFISQYQLFGEDVGLLSFFFFNIIKLDPGQAIFTDAGVPHAYIKGNIIECMANSDNVVRAGLTNKFKDVKTLLDIIKYDFSRYDIINSQAKQDEIVYKTKAEEFEVACYRKSKNFSRILQTENKPSVFLIADGQLNVRWNINDDPGSLKFSKGESFLIPASLKEYEIANESKVKFYHVTIP